MAPQPANSQAPDSQAPDPHRPDGQATAHVGGAHAASLPPVASGRPGRRAIVVGASSGVGAALVRRLVGEGYSVAALARRGGELERLADSIGADSMGPEQRLITRAHDVTDVAEVPALFEQLVRELGGLDLLIYAAGVMPANELREYDTAKDLFTLAVNIGGCIAWCNPTAHLFTTQRSGTIIGLSSIAGDRGRKGFPAYCTSKAAMNTYLEALRNRLSEVGAHVCTIKPGYMATQMTEGLEGLFWVAEPDEAAASILSAARGGANTRYVKRRWWIVGTIIRCIPSFLFKRLTI
jgi:NAD(P)-dependent dehydrogenase (short-subunit alcohol dehydrogenase family)